MKPIIISTAAGSKTNQWFDEELSIPFVGNKMNTGSTLYMTRKGAFVLRRKDNYYEIFTTKEAAAFLLHNNHEITPEMAKFLYPEDSEV